MSVYGMKASDKSAGKGKRMMPRAFRARNMPAALAAVEKALGNEALIVSVRPIPRGPAWQLLRRDGVEVVAMPSAVDSLFPNGGESPADAASREDSAYVPAGGQFPPADAEKMESGAADGLSSSPAGPETNRDPRPAEPVIPAPLAALLDKLNSQGVASAWISQIANSILQGSDVRILADESLARELVRQEMHRRLRSDGGACLIRRKVIFLIGSSGCGKTTACAKIASYAARSLGKQVHWISSDTTRAGAIAKAQAFTAPLGIPLHLTYRPEELPGTLHWESDSELSLVDTPGCNPNRKEEVDELDALLAEVPDRHILWVIPATAKESDLQDMYTAFSHLGIGGVVVTKLDETRSYGGLLNFLNSNRLPIAFLSSGPRIQSDFHSGETQLLVDLLLGGKDS
jgi:flagellar biosynthesis protein FlhF